MDVDADPHTFGAFKAFSAEHAIEAADMAYMGGSIWAARRGVDLDEIVESHDMQSLRSISDSLREDLEEVDLECGENLWRSSKK